MTKIEKLYDSIQTFKEYGLQLPQDLIEKINNIEEEIIKNDIIPALVETISPIIEQIQRGIILVVEYVPNEPLTVKLTRKRSFAIPEEQDINDINTDKKQLVEKERSVRASFHRKSKLNPKLPTPKQLMIPLVKALKQLGGLGTIQEINQKVCDIEQFESELLEVMHKRNTLGGKVESEINYRLAWSKTYLKKYGILENPSRGLWTLVNLNINENEIDCDDVLAHFLDK